MAHKEKMISETGLNLSISYIISMTLSLTFVYPDGDVRWVRRGGTVVGRPIVERHWKQPTGSREGTMERQAGLHAVHDRLLCGAG